MAKGKAGYSIEEPRVMETPEKSYIGFPKSIGRIYDENRAAELLQQDHELAEALRRNWEEHNQATHPRKLPHDPFNQVHPYKSEPFPMIPDPYEKISL